MITCIWWSYPAEVARTQLVTAPLTSGLHGYPITLIYDKINDIKPWTRAIKTSKEGNFKNLLYLNIDWTTRSQTRKIWTIHSNN